MCLMSYYKNIGLKKSASKLNAISQEISVIIVIQSWIKNTTSSSFLTFKHSIVMLVLNCILVIISCPDYANWTLEVVKIHIILNKLLVLFYVVDLILVNISVFQYLTVNNYFKDF